MKLFLSTGLEFMNSHYIKAFSNNQIDGEKLLHLRPYELEEIGIKSVGHQEIILEAVEQLKNVVRVKNEVETYFLIYFSLKIQIHLFMHYSAFQLG